MSSREFHSQGFQNHRGTADTEFLFPLRSLCLCGKLFLRAISRYFAHFALYFAFNCPVIIRITVKLSVP
jgi:hypothetical protein